LLPDDPKIAARLARRLRLANEERDRLIAALTPTMQAPDMPGAELRRVIYRRGSRAAEDRALLGWAGAAEGGEGWRAQVAAIRSWPPPSPPVSGADVGAVLRAFEAWWAAADFPDDPVAIAAQLKALVARAS
jgi:poly(A) polymerase